MRKIVAEIDMHPYGTCLYLFDDRDAFQAMANDYSQGKLDHSGDSWGSTFRCKDGDIFVGIFHKGYWADTTLVHELAHAVIDLFWHVGMEPHPATSEAFCHMQGHLFNECRKALRARRRGAKYVR